jgi:hypothetical protein
MSQSYRIRTELGINKSINVELNQDFEFLEILSLKIQQDDVYTRSCANYGVVVGRVTANNGYGIANAKISVFIPVTDADASNPLISSIYPYTQPSDKNEDGYRYNLLPYEKSYSKHAATGTFPTKEDVLTNATAIEIFDKYYKFTVKTNDSGDYMIMGVPVGFQTLVMDVDLSDIGEFSLTPQDLIRMGLATESQVAGNQFRTSNDLNSLPQLITLNKTVEIQPLWGEPEICQLAINRVDFDLRDDANINIQPTAVFMGSIFSTPDKYRVRKNCKPRDNMGNLCGLTTGPGQILSVRQTINQDTDGNPILEEYRLEQAGNVIDQDGTWLTELPMNLDYVITNEFGEKVITSDPSIGIPTKGKYRFKIKWQQSKSLTESVRRAYFLVPNVREFGWTSSSSDPASGTLAQQALVRSSYYFGLDWSGYTEGITNISDANQKIDEIVNCEDTFYEFGYNRVYTVSGLIDEFKKGGKGRFIGIKEIDDDNCSNSVNKFPVNDGVRNFDFLFFLFSIIIQLFQYIGLFLLIAIHLIFGTLYQIINIVCAICRIPILGTRPFGFLCSFFGLKCQNKGFPVRFPMMLYPTCETCECSTTDITSRSVDTGTSGSLTFVSSPAQYLTAFQNYFSGDTPTEDLDTYSQIFSQAMGGNESSYLPTIYKTPKSVVIRRPSDNKKLFAYSADLPLGERINIFNTRESFFNGVNKIKVSFANDYNPGTFHLDNTITVLSTVEYFAGELLTTVNPATTTDKNSYITQTTNSGTTVGISGTTISSPTSLEVKYANESNQLAENSVFYSLPTGSTIDRQIYPMDREYFQVVTAITVSEFFKMGMTPTNSQTFIDILDSKTVINGMLDTDLAAYRRWKSYVNFPTDGGLLKFRDFYQDYDKQYVLILQRGIDPYSPKYNNRYNLGVLFGSNIDDTKFSITASTRLNIPIQKLQTSQYSVQPLNNQNSIFYSSYFFTPGNDFSGFTSSTIGYYGSMDSRYSNLTEVKTQNYYGANGVKSNSNNLFYNNAAGLESKYDSAEDLSGNALIYLKFTNLSFWSFLSIPGLIADAVTVGYDELKMQYITPNEYAKLVINPMSLSNKIKNVMRLDRLPSSDQLDGGSWDTNPMLLQQNNSFTFYVIPEPDEAIVANAYSTGAQQVSPDIEGQAYADKVFSSFDNCPDMVSLSCYSGFSGTFGIKNGCQTTDQVENGCYVFFTNPLLGLFKDIKYFEEWGYRYRFFYGLCRGVLSQTFANNWVNGSLYMFPIQTDTTYNNQNKPNPSKFCKEVVYFESVSNNFYYRSSPYNNTTNKFIGKTPTDGSSNNSLNLLYPTTIINLGFKDSFYSEITLDPATYAYILGNLKPTSYGDTSDIVNFFVISRIIDENFLQQLLSVGNNSLNQLFTRKGTRVDGDLAQMMSINSEEGVIKFSPEFYSFSGATPPVNIYGTPSKPTIGIFFSSTTDDLQFKDYITPGRIDFRATPTATASPLTFGIKTQTVPFYRWEIQNTNQIFGTEKNTWATNSSGIVQKGYQSLDRVAGDYFKASGIVNDLNMRGYIFNVSGDTALVAGTNYKPGGPVLSNKNIVGAPFHFYFGTVVGGTAIEKFKTKYSIDE